MSQEIKHTPLPWTWKAENGKCSIHNVNWDIESDEDLSVAGIFNLDSPDSIPNAEFIVTACNEHYKNKRKAKAYDKAHELLTKLLSKNGGSGARDSGIVGEVELQIHVSEQAGYVLEEIEAIAKGEDEQYE